MDYRLSLVNRNGLNIIKSTSVAVNTDAVVISFDNTLMGIVPSRGLVLVDLSNEIPEAATTTLPITFSMGGYNTNVTTYGGVNMTVADLQGVGVYLAYYDRMKDLFQIMI